MWIIWSLLNKERKFFVWFCSSVRYIIFFVIFFELYSDLIWFVMMKNSRLWKKICQNTSYAKWKKKLIKINKWKWIKYRKINVERKNNLKNDSKELRFDLIDFFKFKYLQPFSSFEQADEYWKMINKNVCLKWLMKIIFEIERIFFFGIFFWYKKE